MGQLLIVEDDPGLAVALERLTGSRLHEISIDRVDSVSEARRRLDRNETEVILTDLRLGDGSGLDILKLAGGLPTRPTVILMTGNATLETAVEALRLGAFDYLQKPYEEEHLLNTIRRAFESRRLMERVRDLAALTSEDPGSAVQEDPRSKKLFADAERLAAADAPVLLTGESGTGKEVLARYIHAKSPRSGEAFVAINCAAIPEALLEAELFGYEKGAFTGAATQRKGKFELAAGGTLFLDEIGELPLSLQPKLLRVLDGHGFLRLGGQTTIMSAARIIAATNRKIDEEVSAGRFRDDLFFRLNVGRLNIPALRDRPADILPMAERFLETLKRKYRRPAMRLSDPAREKMMDYAWPGNVRELQNALERAVLMSPSDTIDLPDLQSRPGRGGGDMPPADFSPSPAGSGGLNLIERVDAYERDLIQKALAQQGQNRAAAARALGLSKQLLNYKLKKYGLA